MTANELERWIQQFNLTKAEAARQIGLSRVTLDAYLKGREIPHYIELACEALSLRWKDRA